MAITLIAIAALAATSGVFAQQSTAQTTGNSAVTLFGVADVSYTRLSDGAGNSVNILDGAGRNSSSRLGFKGMEDLGGGMAAAFWLEAGVNVDNGTGSNTSVNNTSAGDKITLNSSTAAATNPNASLNARQGLTFNRASTISLIGQSFGEVRLGRDYNPAFWNYTAFDVFGAVGVGSAVNTFGGTLSPAGVFAFPPGNAAPTVRTSNSIGWLSTDMSGLRAQAQLALAENPNYCTVGSSGSAAGNNCPGADGSGKLFATRLSYAAGPLAAAVAYSQTQYGSEVATTPATNPPVANIPSNTNPFNGNLTAINYGASYVVGAYKLTAQMGSLKSAPVTGERKVNHAGVGVAYSMGATTLKASYNTASRSDNGTVTAVDGAKQSQLALGAVYDLSKKTALYGTYSRMTTTAGSSAGVAATGLGLFTGLNAGQSATAGGLDIGLRISF